MQEVDNLPRVLLKTANFLFKNLELSTRKSLLLYF